MGTIKRKVLLPLTWYYWRGDWAVSSVNCILADNNTQGNPPDSVFLTSCWLLFPSWPSTAQHSPGPVWQLVTAGQWASQQNFHQPNKSHIQTEIMELLSYPATLIHSDSEILKYILSFRPRKIFYSIFLSWKCGNQGKVEYLPASNMNWPIEPFARFEWLLVFLGISCGVEATLSYHISSRGSPPTVSQGS